MSELALHELLAPLTPEVFLARHWEREPVHIRGTPTKFERIFSRAVFDAAVADAEARGISIRVSNDHEGDDHGVGVHFPISPAMVAGYLERSVTLCVDPIERGAPALAAFARAVKRALGHAGEVSVKAYLSADGCGFNTHFDRHVATTLQIEGRKRWRFSLRPAVPFPHENGFLTRDGAPRYLHSLRADLPPWTRLGPVDRAEFVEVVLEPGDVLCLPAGTWHEAKALGGSLAINLSFAPRAGFSLLSEVLGPALDADAQWRRSVPAAVGAEVGMPPAVRAYLDERLADLREHLARMTPDDPALVEAWRRSVAGVPAAQEAGPAFMLLRDLARQAAPTRAPVSAATSDDHRGDRPGAAGGLELDGHMTCSLTVRDLGAAIAWYQDKLGLVVRHRVDTLNWCELAVPGGAVTLGLTETQEQPDPPSRVTRGPSVTLGVKDVDSARVELTARGVVFDGSTQEIRGVVKLAPFFDRDGNRLILSQTL